MIEPGEGMGKKVIIMDTTLRDGEQMNQVSYSPEEKLNIARLLLDHVRVQRIEIASARVSRGEEKAVVRVLDWANQASHADKVEVLGFVDKTKSVDWIAGLGGRVINLLAKGSLKHLTQQLKKTPELHLAEIGETLNHAVKRGVRCHLYLEDWSNGMIHSPEYVYFLLDRLADSPVERFLLPDTLGILYPSQVSAFVKDLIERYPKLTFDFHGHNDYGLSVANSLAAVEAGIRCVHVTVNGMGERAGNTALDEVVTGIHDFLHLQTGINEKTLSQASQTVEVYSGYRVAVNKPITGSNVFTQTAGIHADGDKKGNLYANDLLPERFGRRRQYALGKLSGRSSLDYNLNRIGIDLTDEQRRRVLERIVQLGDMKAAITEGDLPYIIADVLDTPQDKTYELVSSAILTSTGLRPIATIKMRYRDPQKTQPVELEASAQGDGGYDAFMNAIHAAMKTLKIAMPKLVDYTVNIPPGGKTDALVQCAITWQTDRQRFTTRGVNSDQVLAAIEATEKMLNQLAHSRGTKAKKR
jgi:D-citramalate synthase